MPTVNLRQRFRANQLARFLNSHRIFFYTLVSLVSVSAVIINALKNYSNFYSVAIYLSKSSRSVLVLANFCVLLALLCGHIIQRIFFGSLRPNEVERLYDRLWFFITESLLAFTIFRDEFDTPFALMFGFLLFVKSFHWLASDRIEWMDQRPYPGPPLSFHFRMTALFAILWVTDCLMFLFAVEHTLTAGVGGMVLFASEYGILMASVMNTILKYLLSTYDLRRAGRRGGENAPPWENKSMWIFYIELATDFLKLTTYLIFFVIIITFYGLPLNILRDVYITARSFVTRLRALHRYQAATRNMDQRYPNATNEELASMSDRTCIICREEMISNAQDSPVQAEGPNTTPKKLPCGHIFHFHCLRSWLERQQSCPTCRRNVLEPSATPVPAPAAAPAAPGQPPHVPAEAQQLNPLAPIDAQNPAGANNNNPLGFIGRFLGPPGPQHPAPNGHMPQNIGQAGQAGGQGGLLINYQVQYQIPRQDGQVEPTQQPQQPQALPPYPGFAGPGGAWQPWPAADGANANGTAPPPPDAAGNTGTVIQESESSEQSSSETPSQTSSQPSSEEPESLSPRETAARAAMSRLGLKPPVKTRPEVPTPTRPSLDPDPRSLSTTTPASPQTAPGPATPSTNSVPVPTLIPLYDFRPQSTITRSGNPSFGNQNPFNGPTAFPVHRLSQPRYGQSSSQGRTNTLPSRLPPTLTDEQLATLDVLTRESIDERLRILEGVSGAVYRCIDDLMRLRSSLPASNVVPGASNGTSSTVDSIPVAQNADQSPDLRRDKGKMPEVNTEAQPDISEDSFDVGNNDEQ